MKKENPKPAPEVAASSGGAVAPGVPGGSGAESDRSSASARPEAEGNGRSAAEAVPGAAAGKAPVAEDLYNQLLRLKAEFENYRRRIDRERPEWIRLGEAKLWERLLPVYDALVHAHELVLKQAAGAGAGNKELAQGLELVFKEFNKIFESGGVRAIGAVGKPYDHDLHEVLGAVETDAQPEGTVVEEIQRGYLLQGKVLRPARVRIAKKKT